MQTDKTLSVFDPWYAHRVDSDHNLYRWYAVWLNQDLLESGSAGPLGVALGARAANLNSVPTDRGNTPNPSPRPCVSGNRAEAIAGSTKTDPTCSAWQHRA